MVSHNIFIIIIIFFFIILENHLEQCAIKKILLREVFHPLIFSGTDFDSSFQQKSERHERVFSVLIY